MRVANLWDDRIIMLAAKELGAVKPNRECYDLALDILNVAGSTTILIGDNIINDVTAAITAGLDAIYLNRHNAPVETVDFPVIQSLNQLVW